MFCGYRPSGEEFENRWRLSEHALGKLCHSIMQFQGSSTDHQQVRARGQLLLPREKNVMNLVTERHLNSFSRLLERGSNRLGWMPTLDQVNKTLIANEKPTLDSLPAVRETEDEISFALSAAREDPFSSASTAATQLLTVTGDPLTISPAQQKLSKVTFTSISHQRAVLKWCKIGLAWTLFSMPLLPDQSSLWKFCRPVMLTICCPNSPVIFLSSKFRIHIIWEDYAPQYLLHIFVSLSSNVCCLWETPTTWCPIPFRWDTTPMTAMRRWGHRRCSSLLTPWMDRNPLNVIDCFPPGLFSHKTLLTTLDTFRIERISHRTEIDVWSLSHFWSILPKTLEYFCLLNHLKSNNLKLKKIHLKRPSTKKMSVWDLKMKKFLDFLEDALLCDFELPAVIKGVSLYHQFLDKLPGSLNHNSLTSTYCWPGNNTLARGFLWYQRVLLAGTGTKRVSCHRTNSGKHAEVFGFQTRQNVSWQSLSF